MSELNQEDEQGKFVRSSTTFRNKITADNSSGFSAEPEHYHLYIYWACSWAHRTAIMRQLKGLIVPIGPLIDFDAPHNRSELFKP
ncbi:MAG: hypothetical protein KME05_01965 [Gloeocapsa sp. UFS-A4-WI-NPMV-4B04]|nr:hypothetical protein [Gloeocapsa sp. UFS-A4-WI-NPMV-4B04]